MNILKSKNFVNEKLNIKPVTKTLLTAIKDGITTEDNKPIQK